MSTRPVLFLGVGHPHAAGRANRLRNVSELALLGAFDDDRQLAHQFALRYGTRAFTDPADALCEARGGLCIVETRNRRGAELAGLALRAGCAVLLDKPGAHDVATLEALRDENRRLNGFVHVGYHMRYSPSVVRGLALVRSGALGRITTGRFHVSVQTPWLTNAWFCDSDDLGGLVFLDACHAFDVMIECLGMPRALTCRMHKLDGVPAHPFEDSAAMIFDYGDKLIAGDVCGWESNDWVDTWNLELYGDRGTLILGLHPPRLRVWFPQVHAEFARGWTDVHHESFDGELNYEYELADVARRLASDQPPGGATLDTSLRLAELAQRCYQDARANGYRH